MTDDNDHSVGYECRDIRHAWEHDGDNVLIEQRGQVRHFARTLACMRCATHRIDEYKISDFAVAKVRTRYVYPTGYRIPGGMHVDDVRLLLFKNVVMKMIETPDEPERKRGGILAALSLVG